MNTYLLLIVAKSRKKGLKTCGLFTGENGFSLSGITYEKAPRKTVMFTVTTELTVEQLFDFCSKHHITVDGIRDDATHLTSFKSESGETITV